MSTPAQSLIPLTAEQSAFAEQVVAGVPFLSFNTETRNFDVDDDKQDVSWDERKLLSKAVRRLVTHPQEPFFFRPVRLDRIRIGFPERCLQHCAYELLDLNVPEAETCWVRNGLASRCLGRLDPGRKLDQGLKRQLIDELGERDGRIAQTLFQAFGDYRELADRLVVDDQGWILLRTLIPRRRHGWAKRRHELRKRVRRFLGSSVDRDVDRILEEHGLSRIMGYRDIRKTVQSIEQHGWDNEWSKRRGSGVLGFSRRTGVYHVLSGKHRIASLRYLLSRGKLDGATLVEYPVITYPWGSWAQWRPHPALEPCSRCGRDGID